MLHVVVTVFSLVGSRCDVELRGPPAAVQILRTELESYGVKVGRHACRLAIETSVDPKGSWTILKSPSGGRVTPRKVATASEAAFVVASWSYEQLSLPLLHPNPSGNDSGPRFEPPAQLELEQKVGEPPLPQDGAPPPPHEVAPSVELSTPAQPPEAVASWSVQPGVWLGIDDGAATWLGADIDLSYQWTRDVQLFFRARAGGSEGARANSTATLTDRATFELFAGVAPMLQLGQLRLRPQLGLGVGALWAQRGSGVQCPQTGSCAPDTFVIEDEFSGVHWGPKALTSLKLSWPAASSFRIVLDAGATFAPSVDLSPDYVDDQPEPIANRAALRGTPWILGYGSLGLVIEIP